jgi:hypothetical protein
VESRVRPAPFRGSGALAVQRRAHGVTGLTPAVPHSPSHSGGDGLLPWGVGAAAPGREPRAHDGAVLRRQGVKCPSTGPAHACGAPVIVAGPGRGRSGPSSEAGLARGGARPRAGRDRSREGPPLERGGTCSRRELPLERGGARSRRSMPSGEAEPARGVFLGGPPWWASEVLLHGPYPAWLVSCMVRLSLC